MRYPVSATFDDVRKKGDPSIYHYELVREGPVQPWKLHRAWRTDQDGHVAEVIVANRVLSTKEILGVFEAGRP